MNRAVGIFKFLSLASAISVYILIVIGGYVSASGAGLACPDWPLCHGQIIPPLHPLILIEFTHRLLTVLVTLLVLLTAFVGWSRLRKESRAVAASTTTLSLLIGQIILGMLTVYYGLSPIVVTAHLSLATGVFASSLITAVLARRLQ